MPVVQHCPRCGRPLSADEIRALHAGLPRRRPGEHNRKLTDAQVAEIRADDGSAREVAQRYDVSQSLVAKIRQGRRRA